MKREKIYKCDRCGRIPTTYKPIRLNVFKYNDPDENIAKGKPAGYKQYTSARVHYDLCRTCFKYIRGEILGGVNAK